MKLKEMRSYFRGVICRPAFPVAPALCKLKEDPLRFRGVDAVEYNLFANYKPRLRRGQDAAPLSSGLYPEAGEELA